MIRETASSHQGNRATVPYTPQPEAVPSTDAGLDIQSTPDTSKICTASPANGNAKVPPCGAPVE